MIGKSTKYITKESIFFSFGELFFLLLTLNFNVQLVGITISIYYHYLSICLKFNFHFCENNGNVIECNYVIILSFEKVANSLFELIK